MKEKMKLQGILWPNMNVWQSEIGSMPKNKAFMTAKKDVCSTSWSRPIIETTYIWCLSNYLWCRHSFE